MRTEAVPDGNAYKREKITPDEAGMTDRGCRSSLFE